ncbi:MAG: choline dehydrogenase [Rhodospirillaceae bacterium]|nr:MAG: choline dehydrogenase [Rhodospirillaceae bacterium]
MSEILGHFDHIIVGAGSAGCVLANRLSADPKRRVLLLEAGGEDWNPWIHVPIGYGKLFTHPKLNWLFSTEPEPGLNNRKIPQPRGRVLGGSSSINGLIYIRGQREDFDHWRQLGCVGWSFDDVLPYFKRAEHQVRGEDAYHGSDGPLTVSDQSEPHELCDALIAAAEQMGLPRNDDFNGVTQEGAGYYQLTTKQGRRCSAATAYLRPVRDRRNLVILPNAHARRILFDGRRAIGIEWASRGDIKTAQANGDIILAAGAINTPHLLQVSGVGGGKLLQDIGARIVHDLPGVGENLQDHMQVRHVFRASKPITLNDDLASLTRRIRIGWRYLSQRKGPLTVSAGYAGAFLRTDPCAATPDLQLLFINFSSQKMGDRLDTFSGFTVSACPLRPESRGWVRAATCDPHQAPRIFANYLGTLADENAIISGMKQIRELMRQPAVLDYWEHEVSPGSSIATDEQLLDYARATGASLYHPTCSSKMGVDLAAVVDPELRVYGLENLRIADGSIMPALVSGNTNAAIIMIGEKASDLVLGRNRA